MGFCLFNNVAVAAAHALAERGAERVLVLDWDVHHGNGTEAIFADSDRGALREHPPVRRSIPGTGAGRVRGRAATGEGYTRQPAGAAGRRAGRVPRAGPARGRARSRATSRPGLIAISAGYDAHRDDPLAECRLETEALRATWRRRCATSAAELDAPVLVCLEGGYDPDALAASVVATLRALQGSDAPRVAPAGPADPTSSGWPRIGPRFATRRRPRV